MKVVQINTVPNGSTGTIMMNIHKELLRQGHESYVVWGRGRKAINKNEIYMNDRLGVYFHCFFSRITGKTGFASKRSTKKLIKRLELIKPDVIHLHNIHGYYLNLEILFNYLKKSKIRVIWTFHDCWPFTGHCAHFGMCKCDKWKRQCNNCPQINTYPSSIVDSSKYNYQRKKELFTSIENLTIITPSEWLASLVMESFFNKYDIKTINNGIDLNVFKIIDKEKLKFRKKYNLDNKKIVLGVASPWTEKKGLKDFIELSKHVDDHYKIVMVGLDDKQISNLPKNILRLKKTNNVEELVDIYNSADVLFNPTYEDNYPTVNLEAQACGLPCIVYDTGGCSETLNGDSNNYIIKKGSDSINIAWEKIKEIENKNCTKNDFNNEYMIKKYIDIYANGE